jgi:protocatechuate 3,4-dioxygenase, beta subunit
MLRVPAYLDRLAEGLHAAGIPGDPLLPYDPIYNSVPDENARKRLISEFSLDITEPGEATGFRFDIHPRGQKQTPTE